MLKENHPESQVYVTGNTAIDALDVTVKDDYHHEVLDKLTEGNRLILMTMHRRENQGEPMKRVFRAVRQVVDTYPDVEVVYPVHLNPLVQEIAIRELGDHDRIHLIEPLDVIDFHNIAARSFLIMSDSGGVQEEAPSLGVPVLVLRDTTERPEGVAAGTLKLVGTETKDVAQAMIDLLDNLELHRQMAETNNPYGDGKTARRILDILAYEFDLSKTKPEDFK